MGYGLVNLLADVITWWGLLLTSSDFSFNYIGGYMDKEDIKALQGQPGRGMLHYLQRYEESM